MVKLVLLRHGESQWNLENRFTGWTDVDLTPKGEQEAQSSGKILQEEGFVFDLIYTSVLTRAIRTMEICLSKMQIDNVPIKYNWRLNERHYGALQGLNKAETKDKFGDEQFMLWRRSYDTPPPTIEAGSEYSQDADPRYADLPAVPLTECLKDVVDRLIPYFEDAIVADLKAGKNVIVAAHGNSLRALVKYLDEISDADIAGLNIPTGIPLQYDFTEGGAGGKLVPSNPGGTYLDPEAAAAGAAAVANQGAK